MALNPIQVRTQRPYSRRQFLATLGKGAALVAGAATATTALAGSGGSLSPRYGHALAYHSAMGQVILFGGARGTDLLSDTWGWTGSKWKKLTRDNDPGPLLLPGLAMMDNPDAGTVLMVGTGAISGAFETWEFNGFGWHRLEIDDFLGPSPRASYAMALDWDRDVVVLFGGGDPAVTQVVEPTLDTWEWNEANTTWKGPIAGPLARTGHAMAAYPAEAHPPAEPDRLICLFGGEDGAGHKIGDDWRYYADSTTPSESTWHGPWIGTVPSPRSGHAMSAFPRGFASLLFGGVVLDPFSDTEGVDNDTWVLGDTFPDPDEIPTWVRATPDASPPARQRHAMAEDANGNVVLFGGLDANGNPLGDTWVFGEAGGTWIPH